MRERLQRKGEVNREEGDQASRRDKAGVAPLAGELGVDDRTAEGGAGEHSCRNTFLLGCRRSQYPSGPVSPEKIRNEGSVRAEWVDEQVV